MFCFVGKRLFLLFREFQDKLVTVKMLFFLRIFKLYEFYFAKAPDDGKTFALNLIATP
jgi:hypothetical protein